MFMFIKTVYEQIIKSNLKLPQINFKGSTLDSADTTSLIWAEEFLLSVMTEE